jgi:hypothetical protein
MIGIPMEMTPTFPTDAPMVFLTESAKFDPAIVSKIKAHLTAGKKVMVTSGFYKAMQGKGIEDIAELEVTDHKFLVREFGGGGFGGRGGPAPKPLDFDIVIPEVRFATNDTSDRLSATTRGAGYPLVTVSTYSKGTFYVLTIPDTFRDLYSLPASVLNSIRNFMAGDMFVRLQGPAQVGLFAYDNNKFIVESFLPPDGGDVDAGVTLDAKFTKLVDVVTGETIAARQAAAGGVGGRGGMGGGRGQAGGGGASFDLKLKPASYRVFSAE